MGFIAALFLLGFLIFIHELGHFTFAKLFNVKVDAFSIGFGPKLIGFRIGETEYKISAIPLGGYVKLLGEQTDEFDVPLPPDLAGRTLQAQTFWRKAAILAAGPVTNLLFPLALYFIIGLTTLGGDVTPPVLGGVYGDPAVEAGLQPGDRVLSVNGAAIDEWMDLQKMVSDNPGAPVTLVVKRGQQTVPLILTPEPVDATSPLQEKIKVGRIGIMPDFDPPVLGVPVSADSARKAGLKTGDKVLFANGAAVKTWLDLSAAVNANLGKPLVLTLLRPTDITDRSKGGTEKTIVWTPPADIGGGGLEPPGNYIGSVDPSTKLGAVLKPGDRILRVNGKPIRHFFAIITLLAGVETEPFTLTYEREGAVADLVTGLTPQERTGPYKELGPQYRLGVQWMITGDECVTTTEPIDRPLVEYLAFPAQQSWNLTVLGVKSLWMLFTGKVELKQLGGPIMIVDVARRAYKASWESYLTTMALISISLGLLNLLPIPLLDGGQLFFYSIEAVRRKELSIRFRERANYVGLFLLVALMVLVFKNDIERYWESVWQFFGGS